MAIRLSGYIKNLNLVSYILILLLVTQLGFFIWCIDRGFDFTDEAFSYIGFRNPGEIYKAATYYTVIFDTFFGWVNVSIITIRIIRLLLFILCGSIFAWGLATWFKRQVNSTPSNSINLFLFSLAGCFLVNAFGTQAFTYNLASTFLFQLITGGFLYIFQRQRSFNRLYAVLFYFLGALLFGLFTVKFTNAILLSLSILFLLLVDKRNFKQVTFYSLLMIGGALTMGLLMFGLTLPQWAIDYKNTLTAIGNQSAASIWSRYVEDYAYIKSSLIDTNAIIITASILLLLLNRFLKQKVLKICIGILISALMAYVIYTKVFYLGGQKHFYVIMFPYILVIFVLLVSQSLLAIVDRIRKRDASGSLYLVIIFLLLIPFFGALGTNNLLSIQVIWYTPFIFAVIYLLSFLSEVYVLRMLVVVLGITGALQAVSGLIYYPYRTSPLYEESNRLAANVSDENIRLNKNLKSSIEGAYRLIHAKTSFEKNDPIFSFASDYGFIYFLHGTLPGWGWYNEVATNTNCRSLSNTKLTDLDRTIFILPVSYQLDSLYKTCFIKMNISFPENYVKLGEVPYSIEVYDRPLAIYAPKSILKSSVLTQTSPDSEGR